MRRLLATLAGVLALPTAAAAQDLSQRAMPRFVVTRDMASPLTEERQLALLIRVGPGFAGPATYWAAERRVAWRRTTERGVTREWIDGRSCPALARVVGAIATLPPMRFGGPDTTPQIPPSHHAVTTLSGPPTEATGAMRISRADYDGAVSAWWRAAERDLAGCWRSEPLVIAGAPVGLLSSEADADRWARRN